MKIAVVHGQNHLGITHLMSRCVLDGLSDGREEVRSFYLPKDGPSFCVGCNQCFLKGETACPQAEKVQPIAQALEWADVIVLDSPNYCMEMSGAMKTLMDHLAYRWVTHRPHGSMFTKVGVAVSSSAGAPPNGTVRSMARQLRWMGVSRVFGFPMVTGAMGVADLKPEKRRAIEKKAARIARAVKKRVAHPRVSLRGRVLFSIFRGMQSSEKSAWNPTDADWWKNQGWTQGVRPWKAD